MLRARLLPLVGLAAAAAVALSACGTSAAITGTPSPVPRRLRPWHRPLLPGLR
jgi:hypothetical protein